MVATTVGAEALVVGSADSAEAAEAYAYEVVATAEAEAYGEADDY